MSRWNLRTNSSQASGLREAEHWRTSSWIDMEG